MSDFRFESGRSSRQNVSKDAPKHVSKEPSAPVKRGRATWRCGAQSIRRILRRDKWQARGHHSAAQRRASPCATAKQSWQRARASSRATYSQAGRARLDEQWDEALEGFARVSEARVAERRDQAATEKAATVPSFLGGRQDQRGRDEVSTSSAIAPAPRKEVGGERAERAGTTIAKQQARSE